jgi:hypothetical protein
MKKIENKTKGEWGRKKQKKYKTGGGTKEQGEKTQMVRKEEKKGGVLTKWQWNSFAFVEFA